MNKSEYTCLALFSFVLLLTGLAFAQGGVQSDTSDAANSWQLSPKAVATEPNTDLGRKRAAARGAFFDKLVGAKAPLDQAQTNQEQIGVYTDRMDDDEIPYDPEGTVLIGTFLDYSPHLSPSRRSVYTDLQVQVNRIVVAGPATVTTGQTIEVLMIGGTAILANGHAIRYGVRSEEFSLKPGSRYLLFLRYEGTDGDFFTLTKSWLINDGKLQPNSPEDRLRSQDGQSLLNGLNEDQAVDAVKETVQDRQGSVLSH